MKFKRAAVLFLATTLTVTTVSTAAQARPPRSSMDRAVAQCIGAVGFGALLGAVIGNNTGSGNAGRGAVAGAVVGAGACAIILAMRDRDDRRRIAELEAEAADADGTRYAEYQGSDGRNRQIKVDMTPVPERELDSRATTNIGPPRECRMRQTTLTVDGQETALTPEQICRDPVTRTWSLVA